MGDQRAESGDGQRAAELTAGSDAINGWSRLPEDKRNFLDLEFTTFQVAEQPSLRLFLYTPADGRSETKLREVAAAASTAKP